MADGNSSQQQPDETTTGRNTHNGTLGSTREQARTFCITINDPTEVLDTFPAKWASRNTDEKNWIGRVRYCIWQYEVAPTTDRRHVQLYIEVLSAMAFSTVKKLLGCPKAHVEKRQGTQRQAIDYCRKEETRAAGADQGPFEYGTQAQITQVEEGKKAKRTDIANAVQAVKQTSVSNLAQTDPVAFVKWHKGLKELEYELKRQKASTEDRQVTTMVFFGEPGSGKTFTAFDFCRSNQKSYYVLNPPAGSQSVWFNGYDGQEVLIIDEMNGSWISWTMLLRLLDKYPLQIQTKGGMTWASWTWIILTSNSLWTTWYPTFRGGMDLVALKRRIGMTLHFTGNEETKEWKMYEYDVEKEVDVKECMEAYEFWDKDNVEAQLNRIINEALTQYKND